MCGIVKILFKTWDKRCPSRVCLPSFPCSNVRFLDYDFLTLEQHSVCLLHWITLFYELFFSILPQPLCILGNTTLAFSYGCRRYTGRYNICCYNLLSPQVLQTIKKLDRKITESRARDRQNYFMCTSSTCVTCIHEEWSHCPGLKQEKKGVCYEDRFSSNTIEGRLGCCFFFSNRGK